MTMLTNPYRCLAIKTEQIFRRSMRQCAVDFIIYISVYLCYITFSHDLAHSLPNDVLLHKTKMFENISIVLCLFFSQINNWLRSQFETLLKEYNGTQQTDIYSVGWNLIFIIVSFLQIANFFFSFFLPSNSCFFIALNMLK